MKYDSFKKFQPAPLRLWHWANAIVLSGLLLTVLLRKTFLSWRTNAALIQEKLTDSGVIITPELAKEIAVSIRNPLWDLHIYLGYGLAVLLVLRLFVSVFAEKNFLRFQTLKSLSKIGRLPVADKKDALHFSIVKLGYYFLYVVTFFMVISGLLLVFKGNLNLSKSSADFFKEAHEISMWFFVVFAVFHIFGVIVAENTKSPGIVSDMINGGESEK